MKYLQLFEEFIIHKGNTVDPVEHRLDQLKQQGRPITKKEAEEREDEAVARLAAGFIDEITLKPKEETDSLRATLNLNSNPLQ